MGTEAQAPERIVAPVSGASKATIESLRARLLSERAASKEARQHAHNIALKVSELQSRLDAEIEHRRKAEVAMKEVLEVLRAKGVATEEVMTTVSSISGSSESGEATQLSSSKDGESEDSSSEEASQVHIENDQGSVAKASQPEAIRSQLEAGGFAEDNFSDKTQILSEDSLRSDGSEVEKVGVLKDEGSLRSDNSEVEHQGMTENEEVNNHKRNVFTDVLEAHPHALRDQVEEARQPLGMLGDFTKHLEGQVILAVNACNSDIESANGSPSKSSAKPAASSQEVESSKAATASVLGGHLFSASPPKEALLQHVGGVEKSKGRSLNDSTPVKQISSGLGDKGTYGGERMHPVDDKMARLLTPSDMAPLVRENSLEVGHNHMHPGLFPRGGYPFEWPYMNVDPLQHMHHLPSAEAPLSRGPMSTTYGAEYGRYLQAPINETVLSLVDDKSGKLGSILMALNLAKQQINDEEYVTSYMEEECEAVVPSPFSGKPYPGLFEGVPHQPPYCPWRPVPQNQAPIIHLPMSPTSDYEPPAFERHDGLQRSSLTSAYYMPVYDPYLQPKGELHLGNGITLYTD